MSKRSFLIPNEESKKRKESKPIREIKEPDDMNLNILRKLLSVLQGHYEENMQKQHIGNSQFYAFKKNSTCVPLPNECVSQIDDLWHGRLDSFKLSFKKNEYRVKLHNKYMKEGMPLVVLQNISLPVSSNPTEDDWIVQEWQEKSSHMLLFQCQPRVKGLDTKKLLEIVHSCSLPSCSPPSFQDSRLPSVSWVMDDLHFMNLSKTWLGVDSLQASCLLADGNELKKMFRILSDNRDNCESFFLLSGQKHLFAYLQINNKQTKDVIFMMPIGTVQVF